ncbi:MAG: 50S ribosomal protein L25 [Patescibacteria group bacterium]
MQSVLLAVQNRGQELNAKKAVSMGKIPAVCYGKGLKERSFMMDYQVFRKVFRQAGENTILELDVEGKEKLNVLVHDVQQDPVSEKIIHVDFINVKMDEVIRTNIPVVVVGVAPAIKELGGILMHRLDEIEVKCLPKDLVHNIEVDVSSLVDFRTSIRVKDLIIPAGITVMSGQDEVVATVVAPTKIEEEVPVVAAAVEGEAVVGAEGAVVEGGAVAEGAAAGAADATKGAGGKGGGQKPEAKK